jgi:hypothetical protein
MFSRKTKDLIGYLLLLVTMPFVILAAFLVFLGIPMAVISGLDYIKGVVSALGF